ncbi:unnamed protein product, partial [Ixodes hexagonus]
ERGRGQRQKAWQRAVAVEDGVADRPSDLDGGAHFALAHSGWRALEHLEAVLLTEHAPVDQVVPVSGHQLAVALDAGEALDVVDILGGPHHVVVGRDHLAAARTGARQRRRPPDVVVPAEDHAGLREAGHADVRQRGLAAGALEAAVVPVAVQRVQQVPVQDLGAAARAAARPGVLVRVLLLLIKRVLLRGPAFLLAAGTPARPSSPDALQRPHGPHASSLLLLRRARRPLWLLLRRRPLRLLGLLGLRRLGCPGAPRRLEGFDHAPAGVPAAPRARLAAPHGAAAAAAADAAAASLLGPCHHRVPPAGRRGERDTSRLDYVGTICKK